MLVNEQAVRALAEAGGQAVKAALEGNEDKDTTVVVVVVVVDAKSGAAVGQPEKKTP